MKHRAFAAAVLSVVMYPPQESFAAGAILKPVFVSGPARTLAKAPVWTFRPGYPILAPQLPNLETPRPFPAIDALQVPVAEGQHSVHTVAAAELFGNAAQAHETSKPGGGAEGSALSAGAAFDGRKKNSSLMSGPLSRPEAVITAENIPGRYTITLPKSEHPELPADTRETLTIDNNGTFQRGSRPRGRWTMENGVFIGVTDYGDDGKSVTEIDFNGITRGAFRDTQGAPVYIRTGHASRRTRHGARYWMHETPSQAE